MSTSWYQAPEVAELLAPGDNAGGGQCGSGEWGVMVGGDAVVYGTSRQHLRTWAQSLLDQIPDDRDEPLVTVDGDRMQQWLYTTEAADPGWEPTTEQVRDLLDTLAADPDAAGWQLGEDVENLWAEMDDNGEGLLAGVNLVDGPSVGIGDPITDHDLRENSLDMTGTVREAYACLALVAGRINEAF